MLAPQPTRVRVARQLLILLLACSSILAADSSGRPSRLYHRSWTFKDGAPQNATMISPTADGFLWVGNSTGVYRFDGVRFERFEPSSGPPLRSYASALAPTSNGGVWVTHAYGGASFIRDGTITNYDEASGLPAGVNLRVFPDAEDHMWATWNTSLLRLEGGRWTSSPADWNVTSFLAWGNCVDGQGAVWLLAAGKLYRMRKGEK